ncbi:MAG: serine hydrolase, partial [Planctomycetaceae bacterium]|nr:serine hydrolase [Planctomycetaceae bacterium]
MRLLRTLLILLLTPSVLQELRADVSAERLAEIPSAMESAVAAGHAAGVVTLVMKDGKIVHHAAVGFADR